MRILLLLCLVSLETAAAGEPARLQFTRIGPTRIGLFLANADGSNERALLPADSLDYTPSFSADGKWIVFTSERGGSADIYRIHPDGSGMERLTHDPAFDDQGVLSPDGQTLAFVSSRDSGFANLWVQDLSSSSRPARPIAKTNAGSFRPSWSPDGKWIAFPRLILDRAKLPAGRSLVDRLRLLAAERADHMSNIVRDAYWHQGGSFGAIDTRPHAVMSPHTHP